MVDDNKLLSELDKELQRRKRQLETWAWDKQINQKASLEDIDLLILRHYLQDMKLWASNRTIDDYLSDKNKIEEFIPPLMGKIGVDRPLHPKNFALMIFGKSPMPIFEVDPFSVTCILPAHPRHRIMKQLSEAENDIIAKNYLNAFEKLKRILNDDIYNYRAMELFCEVNNLMGTPEHVLSLVASKTIDFQHFRLNTLILMAETLSLKKDENTIVLSKKLLEIVVKNRLELQQLIKIAATWSKLGDDKSVIDFVNRVQNEYIHFAYNSYLLDAKGRALINLAKKSKTIFNEGRTRQIKNTSKIDFENYVSTATHVLSDAYNHAENEIQKNYILKALDYIKMELLPLRYKKIK
jgi:hypothetical protein